MGGLSMHRGTEVMIVGNGEFDGIGTGVRLVTLDPDCLPLYPFRFWCLPEKDESDGQLEDVCRETDTQPEAGLDVYTDAVGTEYPEFL